MERLLAKLARQLMACDEASLMNLWNTYAIKVQEFKPTKEWEEAAIIFCMIQSVAFKNQLFNYNLANEYAPPDETQLPVFFPAWGNKSTPEGDASGEKKDECAAKKKAAILRFPS